MKHTLLFLFLILVGCNDRADGRQPVVLSPEQADAASDAMAGLVAIGKAMDQQNWEVVGDLASGAEGHLSGALANAENVPQSKWDVEALQEKKNSEAYAKEGAKIKKSPPAGVGGGMLAAIVGGTMTALMLAAAVMKNVPGISHTIGTIMEMGLAFAPEKFKRKMKAGEAKMKTAVANAVEYGHAVENVASLDPNMRAKIEGIKDALRTKATELGVRDIITAAIKEVRKPIEEQS